MKTLIICITFGREMPQNVKHWGQNLTNREKGSNLHPPASLGGCE
jgi:hypothetical protein